MRIVRNTFTLLLPLAFLIGFPAQARDATIPNHECGFAASNSPAADNPPPPFATRKDESGWWLVGPDGRKFFSLGVCCLHQGVSREAWDPENPSYAAWQNHPSSIAWADTNLLRLRSWGFTTGAGWCDFETLRKSREQKL